MKKETRRELPSLKLRGRTRKAKPPELSHTEIYKMVFCNHIRMLRLNFKRKKTWIMKLNLRARMMNER